MSVPSYKKNFSIFIQISEGLGLALGLGFRLGLGLALELALGLRMWRVGCGSAIGGGCAVAPWQLRFSRGYC